MMDLQRVLRRMSNEDLQEFSHWLYIQYRFCLQNSVLFEKSRRRALGFGDEPPITDSPREAARWKRYESDALINVTWKETEL